MNVMDWFADMPISFNENFNIIEVSFKKGSRKGFYRNPANLDFNKGELVVVEAAQGYDVGEVSLQGELVKLQMKKRKVGYDSAEIKLLYRTARTADIDKWNSVKEQEFKSMHRSREIAIQLGLKMKLSDV